MANPWAKGNLSKKTLNNVKSLEPNTKKYHAMKFACEKAEMTKFLLFTVFAFSTTSHATSWVRISEDNIQTLYVDTDRIVKREKEVVYWTLINYKNNNISSVIKYKTCNKKKNTTLFFLL